MSMHEFRRPERSSIFPSSSFSVGYAYGFKGEPAVPGRAMSGQPHQIYAPHKLFYFKIKLPSNYS
jgi:hypothetical protein